MFDVLSMFGLASEARAALLVAMLPLGLLALLYGYRLIKLFIFMVGFAVGTVVVGLFAETPIALIGGLLVGGVCFSLWYLGIFILGAALGLLVAIALGVREQVVLITCAGVFGMLAIAIRKVMIVIATSWFGANLVVSVISAGLNLYDLSVQLGIAVVLTCGGVICQYTVTSGKAKDAKPSPAQIPNNSVAQKSDETPAQNAQSTTVTRGNS